MRTHIFVTTALAAALLAFPALAESVALKGPDCPAHLVVEDDLRPARSARMVERIEVIRLSDARPAAHH